MGTLDDTSWVAIYEKFAERNVRKLKEETTNVQIDRSRRSRSAHLSIAQEHIPIREFYLTRDTYREVHIFCINTQQVHTYMHTHNPHIQCNELRRAAAATSFLDHVLTTVPT